jgi:A/G-specific adenine glycosylase
VKILDKKSFQQDLLGWYDKEKRDLPWRRETDPYRIWVSEIMLQQTKVDTVIPYYNNFMEKFPTLQDLADADEEKVLKAWEGLGYYSRARNLHTAVKEVRDEYKGKVPDTEEDIKKLQGVGPYTAGAVLSIAYNVPAPAVDGNVMRVLSRLFTIYDDIGKAAAKNKFEQLIREIIAENRASDFNQAVMELGAVVCTPTSPACLLCPVEQHCSAKEEGVQDLLPVKAKKKPPRTVRLKALVLQDGNGRFLVEKRPDTGLLAKLWQFPYIEESEETDEDIASFAAEFGGVAEGDLNYYYDVKHVFSHLVWEIKVYRAEGEINNIGSHQRLLAKEELKEFTFPVSHQKIMKSLEEE